MDISQLNTEVVEEILEKQNQTQCEGYALSGIKTIGALIAASSNEHVAIRIAGGVLALTPIQYSNVRKAAFLVSFCGYTFATNKKKALLQRVFSLGSIVIGVGIVSVSNKPKL